MVAFRSTLRLENSLRHGSLYARGEAEKSDGEYQVGRLFGNLRLGLHAGAGVDLDSENCEYRGHFGKRLPGLLRGGHASYAIPQLHRFVVPQQEAIFERRELQTRGMLQEV